jgi:hypothetical protein
VTAPKARGNTQRVPGFRDWELQLLLVLAAHDLAGACIVAAGFYDYGDELRSWWHHQPPDAVITGATT